MLHALIRCSLGLAGLILLLPAVQGQPVPDNQVLLVIRVHPAAVLTIDGKPTRQTGSERTFISPSLTPGKDYFYSLKATWIEGGQTHTASKTVYVRAGQRTEVDLSRADAPARVEPPALPVEPEPVKPKPVKPKSLSPVKTRTFLFTYRAMISGLAEGKIARVWLPVPSSSDEQEIEIVDTRQIPADHKIDSEPLYGNRILYCEVKGDKDGNASLAITYKVKRKEVKGPSRPDIPDARLVARFLQPDLLVPIDGKPLELIRDRKLPADQMALGKMLYDLVNQHMKYDKSKPGYGKGDAVWACDSKFGNCTDFHSLFISLARSQKIPAKFEMGFPLPPARGEGEIGGYHCWAFFKPEGKGWVGVDISEANRHPNMADYYFGNLTEDRVTFTTGRDFDLVPKQDGPPLNYLIYPYVEIDGKEAPAAQVKRSFAFRDIAE